MQAWVHASVVCFTQHNPSSWNISTPQGMTSFTFLLLILVTCVCSLSYVGFKLSDGRINIAIIFNTIGFLYVILYTYNIINSK